jgi:Protein of unknown function (DUF2752)
MKIQAAPGGVTPSQDPESTGGSIGPLAPFDYGPGLGIRDRRMITVVGAIGAGAVSALVRAVPRVGPLCPMRRVFGVPCPACGTTTAVVALGTLRLFDAVAANPVIVVAIVFLLAAWLPVRARNRLSTTWAPVHSWWRSHPRRVRWPVVVVGVLGLWLYQLHRFDSV